jgi:hypothetical protein
MNTKIYNAVQLQLRGKAIESLAVIEHYLNNPTMVPDHSTAVDEIIKHSKLLSEYEGAFSSLQQYFHPPQAASPTPSGDEQDIAEKTIGEQELMERSPTYRKSQTNRGK